MRGERVETFDSFLAGWHPAVGPYELAPGDAEDVLGMLNTSDGALTKRDGIGYCTGAFTNTPSRIFFYEGDSDADNAFIVNHGNVIQKVVPPNNPTNLTGIGNLTNPAFIQAPATGGQGPVYMIDGSGTPQWANPVAGTGGAWTASAGAVPNGKLMVYAGNRIFVAGVTATPSRLYWSEIGDPRNWPAANVTDFDPSDGEPITSLGVSGSYVLVFKRSKLWAVYDLNTSANRRVGENIGCVAPLSVVETEQGTFFLDRLRGVMITDGQTVRSVSDRVRSFFNQFKAHALRTAAGAYCRGRYYLSIRNPNDVSTSNLLLLDLDTAVGEAWWKHELGAPHLTVATFPSVSGHEIEAVYAATINQVNEKLAYRLFVPGQPFDRVNNTTNRAISYMWKGPPHDFGDPAKRKRLRQVRVNGIGTADFYIHKDLAPGGGVFAKTIDFLPVGPSLFGVGPGLFGVGPGLFGSYAGAGQERIPSLGVARQFQIRVQGDNDDPFTLYAYSCSTTPRSD